MTNFHRWKAQTFSRTTVFSPESVSQISLWSSTRWISDCSSRSRDSTVRSIYRLIKNAWMSLISRVLNLVKLLKMLQILIWGKMLWITVRVVGFGILGVSIMVERNRLPYLQRVCRLYHQLQVRLRVLRHRLLRHLVRVLLQVRLRDLLCLLQIMKMKDKNRKEYSFVRYHVSIQGIYEYQLL